ncbi:MAG: hypothetical protein M1818_002840 [Claussenomyces sp. TS43310]|nr:MAG: hypothetical protein M1818_002840 [Claussenomyces sp. TS43310]
MHRRIQQLPIDSRIGYDAIFDASYLDDIPQELQKWSAKRVILVLSKSLDAKTDVIRALESKLGHLVVAKKRMRSCRSHRAATAMAAADMEALIDQQQGITGQVALRPPRVKMICLPTALSASRWNHISSATNARGKKQQFGHDAGAPELIVLDPGVAAMAPERLWLSSGVRALDHCIETICNPQSDDEVNANMQSGLGALLKGLREYKAARRGGDTAELLRSISDCQAGSRKAMLGILHLARARGAEPRPRASGWERGQRDARRDQLSDARTRPQMHRRLNPRRAEEGAGHLQ